MMTPASLVQLRRKPHWSYSSLNTLLNICSLQWAFRYVYRIEPAFTPVALVFGGAFHKALEYAFRLRLDGHHAPPDTVADLFSDVLAQQISVTEPNVRIPEGNNIDGLHQTGRKMVAAYLESFQIGEKVVQVSAPFSVPLEDAEGRALAKPLIGEFDCVVEVEGRPVVVDWKTSARRWPKDKERQDLQPTCYLHAFRASGGRRNVLFRYDIITKAKDPSVEKRLTVRHPDHMYRLVEQIKVAEKMIRSELFLPNEQSWACKGCAYGMACEGWHRERARSLYDFQLVA